MSDAPPPSAPKSPLSGLFSRGSSAPAKTDDPGSVSAAPGVTTSGNDNKPAAPRSPLSGGLFGSRSAPPAPAMSTTSAPIAPAKVDESSDSADKPAAPRSPLSGGLFGSRSAPPAPAMSTTSAPAKTDNSSDAADNKPAAPRSPVPGGAFGSAFGSRSAPPAALTPAKADELSDDADNKPAVPRSPLSGGSFGSAFGSRSTPLAPAASTASAPAKVDDLSDAADDKPAAPRSPFGGGSVGGAFGARTLPPAASTPAKVDDSSDADNKPAAPRSPLPGGSFGSAFGSRSAPPATSTPAKVDDSSDDADNKPAAPRSPLPGGSFGSAFGARSAPPAASTPAKVDESSDTADNKPVAPRSPLPGGTFGSAFGSRSTPPAASTPAKADESSNAADNKPIAPRSPLPVGSVGGAFGARTIAPNSTVPLARPVVKPTVPLDDEDDDDLDDDDPKYVPLDEVEDAEPRPTPNRPLTPSSAAVPTTAARPSPFSSAPRPQTPAVSVTGNATGNVITPPVSPVRTSTPLIRQPAASSPVPAADAKPVTTGTSVTPTVEGVIVRSKGDSAWELPNYQELLEKGSQRQIDNDYLMERARVIEDTLQSFGAPGNIVEINSGPVITQFGVEPDFLVSRQGKKTRVKVSSIAKLDADLALALAARSIRIEAPVPGKGYVGIEVPNAKTALVGLRDIMDSEAFAQLKSKLRIGLGQSVDGAPVAVDLTSMPHLLIAGTTGSGKSVCVNAIIVSLLLENSPDDVKFIMVDPKRVELTGYNGIPHLVAPVVVDLERIVGVLKWVTREMDERYKKFSQIGARHLIDYNARLTPGTTKLPYLVVVIDELADLMMLAPDETEKVLTRLAQMARATGIHLIVSTQRPSVDVVTGLIKANFPARISFAVASSVDLRVILDSPGAEKLLGRGDMLYQAPDAAAPVRMQGVYVSDNEINRITRYWKTARLPNMPAADSESAQSVKSVFDMPEPVQSRSEKYSGSGNGSPSRPLGNGSNGGGSSAAPSSSFTSSTSTSAAASTTPKPTSGESDEDEEMYHEAVELVKRMNNKVSVSLLQRKLRIGYMRAARLIELMKQRGLIDASNIADGKTLDEEA